MAWLKKNIEDIQCRALIRAMLNAGYVEDWQCHKTYSGTPQGGIGSPILANISLHAFDEYREQKKQEMDRGKGRQAGTEWYNTKQSLKNSRRRIEALKSDQSPEASIRTVLYEQHSRELSENMIRLPASDPLDPEYRRLFYIRYADDGAPRARRRPKEPSECVTVQPMRDGPSEPACRSRFQTTSGGCGQKPWW